MSRTQDLTFHLAGRRHDKLAVGRCVARWADDGWAAPERRAAVTATLPPAALAWIGAHTSSSVVDVSAADGGITRTKWTVQLADGQTLILRWSDPQVWGATGRDHVRREAAACRLLADSGVPVPRLIATDGDGGAAGGAANLMSRLPGATRLDPLSPVAVEALAQLTVRIHRQSVPASERPALFAFRVVTPSVPDWTRRGSLWKRAIDLSTAGSPATPYGLLHRDLHLGNLLWQGDRVSGIVDWAETSWGPADLDVAHLCSDFAMLHSLEAAEAFRSAYLDQGGRLDPDPAAARFWAVADILGFLPDPAHILAGMAQRRPDLTADQVRRRLEELLASTLAGT